MEGVVLEGVGVSYDGVWACKDIHLGIRKGEFFTFLGPSGCGKTTLLRLIAGFITPQSGAVFLDGKDITHLAPEKRKVGMVFQNYSLFPFLTVYQNIEYGVAIQNKTPRERKETVALYMDMVGLAGFGGRKVTELSGGEQQRVALARSLAVEPSVLLLDEPLSNLDARLRDAMRGEIKSLQKRLGITTIFVTHDQTEALTLSDRVAVFNKGRVEQIGTPLEIYNAPRNVFVAGFVGDTNLFRVTTDNDRARLAHGIELRMPGAARGQGHLSIRPQDIELSSSPVDAPNTLQGQLAGRQLNGVWIDLIVHVGEFVFRVAQLNTAARKSEPQPGEPVWMTLPEKALRLLED
ncbi:ABC transporter ATP-binding protein [Oceanidesulfovibrio marinus]|uniref:ABC transporter ATP-binding protein n=1 Tax=Oceanidesulfovibrio marinus TaxID=370038 RepID=A0A6P1ZE93_9BACT|nr:ABC transporter ATP-binding protein [Oceanidesulfovibrio marinus]QJT07991.1 ABC transporter ATP-binding protein [Oceanidesulfovibrio marinus]TVM30601.1 ABC transporter ATP-binding protein [Oceanidesulfovibrio marinus]